MRQLVALALLMLVGAWFASGLDAPVPAAAERSAHPALAQIAAAPASNAEEAPITGCAHCDRLADTLCAQSCPAALVDLSALALRHIDAAFARRGDMTDLLLARAAAGPEPPPPKS